jgi:hypothetical protein
MEEDKFREGREKWRSEKDRTRFVQSRKKL